MSTERAQRRNMTVLIGIFVRDLEFGFLTNMGRRKKVYNVYIMVNRYHTVFYTGMTGRELKRTSEHKSMQIPGFTSSCR